MTSSVCGYSHSINGIDAVVGSDGLFLARMFFDLASFEEMGGNKCLAYEFETGLGVE